LALGFLLHLKKDNDLAQSVKKGLFTTRLSLVVAISAFFSQSLALHVPTWAPTPMSDWLLGNGTYPLLWGPERKLHEWLLNISE
jgi:hypothetical protein